MPSYTPPVRDITFVLDTISDVDSIIALPKFEHVDPDTIDGVLDEAARFFSEVFAPTNEIGDEKGATLEDGAVITPDEFKPVWNKLVDAGWTAVTGSPEYGGHGFPKTVISCEWTGTMVLTEPEAGSDVGAVRTRAHQNEDGSYAISGSKIFITWGDHDLTENIIHLVLARTPDAPPGTKGISLFVVPKFVLDENGNPGNRNAVEIVSIEHKLGIHASPTCVMSFDKATGYLVGEENHGMRYMFTMMNQARLEVGLEGLSVAQRAYEHAAEYAKERIQGRALGSGGSSSIIDHADVRRMLMTMKAYSEAMRCLVYDAAAAEDRHQNAQDEAARVAAGNRLALLTPIAKSWCTDRGVEIASIGIQVLGGMGFIEESGAAQFYRDVRITPIYEGTNGIQALDLVMRKLPMDDGSVITSYLDEIAALDGPLEEGGDELEGLRTHLAAALGSVRTATEWLNSSDDVQARMAGATPYQEMLGTLAGGYYLARQALAALQNADSDSWLAAKISTARFYGVNLLPKVHGLLAGVTDGPDLLFAIDDEHIGAPA